jgi:hypothetical protein
MSKLMPLSTRRTSLVATNITRLVVVPNRTILYDILAVGHPADRGTHKELAPKCRRPLAALASVVLTVSGLVLLLPECASACSYAILGSREERALAESRPRTVGRVATHPCQACRGRDRWVGVLPNRAFRRPSIFAPKMWSSFPLVSK